MLFTQLLLVDGKCLLLVLESASEITLTRLCSRDQVITDSHLQTFGTKVPDVEGEGMLQEAQ